MRAWMLRGRVMLLSGTLLAAVSGCGHNPNQGINRAQARAAARRLNPAPPVPADGKLHYFRGPNGETYRLRRVKPPDRSPVPGVRVMSKPDAGR